MASGGRVQVRSAVAATGSMVGHLSSLVGDIGLDGGVDVVGGPKMERPWDDRLAKMQPSR
jgi:hypothetical protein